MGGWMDDGVEGWGMAEKGFSEAVPRVSRVVQILMLVAARREGQRITRGDLAAACGCSVRSIGRDIDAIRLALVPLDWDAAAGTFKLPAEGWAYPAVHLTGTEALALALAGGLLTGPTLPYANAVRDALRKVTAGLPSALLSLIEAQAALIHTAGKARDYSHAPYALLMDAAVWRKGVEIDYESRRSGDRSWRRVDPYGMEESSGRLELHGWCHRREQVLTFAVDRILDARLAGECFEVREAEWQAFRQEQGVVGGLRGGESVEVNVRFDGEVALFARDYRWPLTLTPAMQRDGSLLLTGTALGLDGIVPELLRWRRHVKALGGEALRWRMAEETEAMAELYRK